MAWRDALGFASSDRAIGCLGHGIEEHAVMFLLSAVDLALSKSRQARANRATKVSRIAGLIALELRLRNHEQDGNGNVAGSPGGLSLVEEGTTDSPGLQFANSIPVRIAGRRNLDGLRT